MPSLLLSLFVGLFLLSSSALTLSSNFTNNKSAANGTHFITTTSSILDMLAPNNTTNYNYTTDENITHFTKEDLAKYYATFMEDVVARRWEDTYNVAFLVGIIPALAALASVGNILVLTVASISPQFRTVSCIFLTNLSAIDAFQTIVIVPIRAFENFVIKFPFKEYWVCKLVYTLREALYICYVHTFILIALERFIVVVYPMKAMHICTKKRARLAICTIWMLSLVLAIPNWFQMSLVGADSDWPICTRDIIRRNYPGVNVALWRKIHESYSLFLLYVLPLMALAVCYAVVAVALYRSIKASQLLTQRTMNSISYSKSQQQQQQKIVPDLQRERILVLRMCIVLVTFFALCQGPWRIHYWMNVLMPDVIPREINRKLHSPLFALCVLNSAVNPVIYGFMSRNFRQAFVVVMAKWCMIPMQVYNRRLLRWHVEKEGRRNRKKLDEQSQFRNRSSTTDSAKKTCETDVTSKSSNSQRASLTDNKAIVSSSLLLSSSSTKSSQHHQNRPPPPHHRNYGLNKEHYHCNSLSESEPEINGDNNKGQQLHHPNIAIVVVCDEPSAEIDCESNYDGGVHPTEPSRD